MFPILRDAEYVLTDMLGARVTPEVYVVDADLRVRYQGMIDNWATVLGQHRSVTTAHQLQDALDSLAAGPSRFPEPAPSAVSSNGRRHWFHRGPVRRRRESFRGMWARPVRR